MSTAESVHEIPASILFKPLERHSPSACVPNQALQLILPMRWNGSIGVQGKAVDTGTAGLIRYTARGAVSLERLEADAKGDLLYTFTRPWSDGTTGITLSPLELLEKLAALVPLPRMHLVRYGGCLAPHSQLRHLITPTPRQRGVDAPEAGSVSPRWGWARLLKRVFAFDLERCPACGRGTLRIIAAITQAEVIRKILRHCKLAADPSPIAPARACQATFAWTSP
jgi:hypothetical protein